MRSAPRRKLETKGTGLVGYERPGDLKIINMKKSCKNIDIKDINTIRPWVEDCCRRHKKRHDFRKLFLKNGMTKAEYDAFMAGGEANAFSRVVGSICEEAVRQLTARKLELKPVVIGEQADSTTGKVRQIGCESPMQQIFDYIAVYSAMDIFRRRMVHEQASSIPGRGQVYGMRLIKKWIEKDNRAAAYARKHKQRYISRCRYFVKLDIKKCYPFCRQRYLPEII